MSFDDDEMLPGDTFKINDVFTVASFDGYTISTAEGPEFDTMDIDFEVTQKRPENWPPQTHDVWRLGHDHLHALDDDLYNEYGQSVDLAEVLSDSDASVADLMLVFRPGFLEAVRAKK